MGGGGGLGGGRLDRLHLEDRRRGLRSGHRACTAWRSRAIRGLLAGCAVGMAQWHASVGPTKAQFHWGIRSLQELTDCHPRLRLLATHSVAASHGWMGIAAERMWSYWSSTPLYGVVELGVD